MRPMQPHNPRPHGAGRRSESRRALQRAIEAFGASGDPAPVAIALRDRLLATGAGRRWHVADSAIRAMLHTYGRATVANILARLPATTRNDRLVRGVAWGVFGARGNVTRAPGFAPVMQVAQAARRSTLGTLYYAPGRVAIHDRDHAPGSGVAAPERILNTARRWRAVVEARIDRAVATGDASDLLRARATDGATWRLVSLAFRKVGPGFLRYVAGRLDRSGSVIARSVARAVRDVADTLATEARATIARATLPAFERAVALATDSGDVLGAMRLQDRAARRAAESRAGATPGESPVSTVRPRSDATERAAAYVTARNARIARIRASIARARAFARTQTPIPASSVAAQADVASTDCLAPVHSERARGKRRHVRRELATVRRA